MSCKVYNNWLMCNPNEKLKKQWPWQGGARVGWWWKDLNYYNISKRMLQRLYDSDLLASHGS